MLFLFTCSLIPVIAQISSPPADKASLQSLIGSVLKINQDNREISVKTAEGQTVNIKVTEKATFARIKPTDKTLEKATQITIRDIIPNSRILARGEMSKDTNEFAAQMIVVVAEDNAAPTNSDRTNIQGVVSRIDIAKKEITIKGFIASTPREITINASSTNINFRRYAANSIKFNDSLPSGFENIKVGDQLKGTGKLSIEGLSFSPETIISGTFRTIGGSILSIDLSDKVITVSDMQSRQPIKIKIDPEINLKKLTTEKSKELITLSLNKNSQKLGGAPVTGDLKSFFDTLPATSLEQLKVGSSIIMSAILGDNNTPSTAFQMLTDVEPLFKTIQENQKKGQPMPYLGGLSL